MFGILKRVFGKTTDAIKGIVPTKKKKITKDEFEDILLEADVNYALIEEFLEKLPNRIDKAAAYNTLISVFQYKSDWKTDITAKPFIEIIVGVNGAGKTTTIAKLARYHQKQREQDEVLLSLS
jgi:fused signal recognition particle receptor